MHARLSTYTGEAGELTRGFERQTEPLEQLDGFRAAYFGVSESGKAFSLTLWDSQDALEIAIGRDDIDVHTCQIGGRRVQLFEQGHEGQHSAEPQLVLDHQVAAHAVNQRGTKVFEQLHQHLEPAPDQVLTQRGGL